jgi:hypothetical protein
MVNITTISHSDDGNAHFKESVPAIPTIRTRVRAESFKLIEPKISKNNDINSAVKSAIKGL